MITKDDSASKEMYRNIIIVCPTCKTRKELKIPIKIINQAKQLTTISIPSNLCCKHSFQAFIDKNFSIRSYQTVDFEFTHMEFYESSNGTLNNNQEDDAELSFTSLPIFQQIIQLLRDCVDDKEILGSGMFTIDGNVLYSSLPSNTLFSIMNEFQVRSEEKLIEVKNMYFELENNEKFISKFMEINNLKFNLVLMFSFRTKFGMGNLHLRDLLKKIEKVN
ncbi:MAG: hypothetical protein ACFE9I_07095 [Candidatus Hermodarchaeota archaeon]